MKYFDGSQSSDPRTKEAEMADTIDKGLYNEAVDQIVSALSADSKSSPEVKQIMAAHTRTTAERMFASAWHTARQLEEEQRKHVASRAPLTPPKRNSRLDSFPPEVRERLERNRTQIDEMFAKNMASNYAMVDEHHEKTLLALFMRKELGIGRATAEKLVAAVKEKSK
jgi:hypothetical protein